MKYKFIENQLTDAFDMKIKHVTNPLRPVRYTGAWKLFMARWTTSPYSLLFAIARLEPNENQ